MGVKRNEFSFAAFFPCFHSYYLQTSLKKQPQHSLKKKKHILNQVFLTNSEVRPVSLQVVHKYQY